ncbi:MAG: pyrroline-5-carboxylate reductase [Deltaproteobacteria bacterium]|nr:pyrroline-5-carboxylate reductase [Deltaproteobacteria bacterium]
MATTSDSKSTRSHKSAAVLIIGAGNMGGALAKGLSDSGFTVAVHDIHSARVDELCKKYDVRAVTTPEVELANIDALIFCVKPQDLVTVTQPLAGKIRPNTLVVSILAGTPIAAIEETLRFQGGVVRAMPNIAATVHAAATGMSASPACTDDQKILAERIFRAIGEADWIKEPLLDAVTGLSGSGPAYLYMVIEALTDGGVKMGIPRAQAARLATQTVLGSALLVKETGLHPAILRDQVTTPGGTTISAIHELEDRGLRAMLISAVETATKRSAALRSK